MTFNQNLNELMKQAQIMQQRMQDAQQELGELVVSGESGGGMVKIKMNGRHEVLEINANPSLHDDVDMLLDLVIAAVNDSVRKVEKASKEKIAQLTAGLNLPTDILKNGG